MKENMFFAEKIMSIVKREKVCREKIDEVDDFPGKEDFIRFYMVHNGVDFTMGAWFFPETCFNISMIDTPITLGSFLRIRVEDKNMQGNIRGLDMDNMNDLIVEKYSAFEDFVLFHIPFALDVVQNPFWIDTQTGEIKYISGIYIVIFLI